MALYRLYAHGRCLVSMVQDQEYCKSPTAEPHSDENENCSDFFCHFDRYYVLVVACVIARNISWLRNPCLAAVLLVPAVAAIHGVVLAALHQDGKRSRYEAQLYQTDNAHLQALLTWTSMGLSS